MSGNLWMFSDMLDDEDIEILKHEFITYYQGADYYGLTNKYIVLDLSELKGKLLPVGMMIALDYVWDNIKADRTKKKAIMIDEIWQLIGASSNKMAAEFCLEIFKVIRGYGGAAIAATQDLSDFFSLDDGKYGRAIINNSKNKIILNLEQDEAQYVQDVLKLTRTEVRSITQFERGEALIHSNNNKVPVVIKAWDNMKRNILALIAHVLVLSILLTIFGCISLQRSEAEAQVKFTGELERNVTLRILENDTAKEKGYFKELLDWKLQ